MMENACYVESKGYLVVSFIPGLNRSLASEISVALVFYSLALLRNVQISSDGVFGEMQGTYKHPFWLLEFKLF